MKKLKVNIGDKFGRLTVVDLLTQGRALCKCDCGKVVKVRRTNLTKGISTSCGCYRVESNRERTKAAMQKLVYEETIPSKLTHTKLDKRNTTGVTGVTFNKHTQKYVAMIGFQKQTHYLGSFNTVEEAIEARKEGERRYWDPFLAKMNRKTLKQEK